MTLPCLWGSAPYSPKSQDVATALVGRQPAARSQHAKIGTAAGPNLGLIASFLSECAKDGTVPVLWMSPENDDLDAGTVDVPGLPNHPSVALVADVIAAHPAPVVVRPLGECANTRGPATGGTPSYRYVSSSTFRAAFDGVAAVLRAKAKNAIIAWSYGPNGWPYNPAEWSPKPESWDVGDCSLWGEAHLSMTKVAGKNAHAHALAVAMVGKPLIVGESGSQTKDAPLGWTDKGLLAYMKKHLAWCLDHDVRLMAGPFPSDDMGMTDWTLPEYPQTQKYLIKMLNSPAFYTLPLPTPAQPSLLVAAGMIKP